MYEIIMPLLGITGTALGIYSLALQLRDRYHIEPKIEQTFVRITPNLDYLIQVTLVNVGGRAARNCNAQIFEDENPLADLSHMPIDSPLGRISPDWPVYSNFNIFPKTPIIVRAYLDSKLQGHQVHIQLYYNDNVIDRSNKFTLPVSPAISHVVEHPADVDKIDLTSPARAPQPSYPSDRWEFLWFRYTGNNEDPWGDFINRSIKYEINFDYDWGLDEVDDTGETDKVGFIASRTIQIIEPGETKFTFGSDDGIRFAVYDINSIEIFRKTEYWKDQTYGKPHYHTQFLPAGEYKIKIEWYENMSSARVIFKIDKLEARTHIRG